MIANPSTKKLWDFLFKKTNIVLTYKKNYMIRTTFLVFHTIY